MFLKQIYGFPPFNPLIRRKWFVPWVCRKEDTVPDLKELLAIWADKFTSTVEFFRGITSASKGLPRSSGET